MNRRLIFSSKQSLEAYLKSNPEGQELAVQAVSSVLPYWLCTEEGQAWMDASGSEVGWASVLIVIRGDGFIEAITDGNVSVRIVQTPDQCLSSEEITDKCEQYVKNDLSLRWQRVWDRGKVQAVFMFKPLTIGMAAAKERTMAIISTAANFFS